MNRHVGASFSLSVLSVVFFAVVLYQPDRPPAGHPAPAPTVKPVAAHPGPAPTPGVALVEASAEEVAPSPSRHDPPANRRAPASPSAAPPIAVASTASPSPLVDAASRPPAGDLPAMVQTISHRRPPASSRRSSFTRVLDGESLADVAVRVYGTPEAGRALWLANRDILEHRDAVLRKGTLLRTP